MIELPRRAHLGKLVGVEGVVVGLPGNAVRELEGDGV